MAWKIFLQDFVSTCIQTLPIFLLVWPCIKWTLTSEGTNRFQLSTIKNSGFIRVCKSLLKSSYLKLEKEDSKSLQKPMFFNIMSSKVFKLILGHAKVCKMTINFNCSKPLLLARVSRDTKFTLQQHSCVCIMRELPWHVRFTPAVNQLTLIDYF